MANDIIRSIITDIPPASDHTYAALIVDPRPELHPRALDKIDPTPTEQCEPAPQTTVAATLYSQLPPSAQAAVLAMDFNRTSYGGPPIKVELPMNQLPTLGILLRDAPSRSSTTIYGCQAGTAVSKLPRWRSQLQAATIRRVDDNVIRTKTDFIAAVATLRQRRAPKVTIIVARHEIPLTPTLAIP